VLIKKEDCLKFENPPSCIGYEYPLEDKDINIAVIEVKGRYPTMGYAMNELVKEVGCFYTTPRKGIFQSLNMHRLYKRQKWKGFPILWRRPLYGL